MAATPTTRRRERRADRRTTRRTLRTLRYTAFYLCLALIAVVFVAPYVLAVFGALKPTSAIYGTSPWTLPHSFYTGNFTTILFTDDFVRYLANTALVTSALTIGQ